MIRTVIVVLSVCAFSQQGGYYEYNPYYSGANLQYETGFRTIVDIQRSHSWYLASNGQLIPYYSEGFHQSPFSESFIRSDHGSFTIEDVPYGDRGYSYTVPFRRPPSSSYGAPSGSYPSGGLGEGGDSEDSGANILNQELENVSNEVEEDNEVLPTNKPEGPEANEV